MIKKIGFMSSCVIIRNTLNRLGKLGKLGKLDKLDKLNLDGQVLGKAKLILTLLTTS
jgi:hypothetical protein